MENLDTLLNDVSELKEHKEKEKRDNDMYNVFNSIGFKTQEVMHSKFIASLLNPKESHGKKNLYLNLFLNVLDQSNFISENIVVRTEKSAGKRRIDITIENHESIIIIENKIWAPDQDQQLEDYYQFCKNKGKKVVVIYLTPYGRVPSDYSLGLTLKKEEVICISYEKKILPWIRECAKMSTGRLKTSLEMYAEMIEILINRDRYMSEIFNYLKENKEKLKIALRINSALQGRNFITEFPELMEYLRSHVNTILCDRSDEDEEPQAYIDINRIVIEHPDDQNLNDWQIVFDEGEVYAEKGENKLHIFYPTEIGNEKLQSLILNDDEKTDTWINNLLDEMNKSLIG